MSRRDLLRLAVVGATSAVVTPPILSADNEGLVIRWTTDDDYKPVCFHQRFLGGPE